MIVFLFQQLGCRVTTRKHSPHLLQNSVSRSGHPKHEVYLLTDFQGEPGQSMQSTQVLHWLVGFTTGPAELNRIVCLLPYTKLGI